MDTQAKPLASTKTKMNYQNKTLYFVYYDYRLLVMLSEQQLVFNVVRGLYKEPPCFSQIPAKFVTRFLHKEEWYSTIMSDIPPFFPKFRKADENQIVET